MCGSLAMANPVPIEMCALLESHNRGCSKVNEQVGWQLGVLILVAAGTLGGAILGPGVSAPGTIGAPEFATAGVCGAMILGYFYLFMRTTFFDVWEARFWGMPWSDSTPAAPGEMGRRSAPFIGQPCPFTGGQSAPQH